MAYPHYTIRLLLSSSTSYTFPTDFLRERLVKYKGIEARRWTLDEIDALRANPQTKPSESNPFYYIWEGKICFEVDSVTQANGDEYEIWYVKQPTDIGDSADPDLPEQFHNPLEDFAVARCLEQATGDWEASEVQMAHFLEQCMLVNSRYSGKPAFDGIPSDPRLEVLVPQAAQ